MLALLTITTLAVGCVTTVVGSDGDVDGVVNVQGYAIPQLGIGVGNLPKDSVSTLVRSAVDDHHIVLIDTARQSKNENFVREAIESLSPDAPVPIVLTKVWYTYLGYNRTILSVEKSLAELGKTCLDIVLLHWPRCNDKISWMNCKEEEENLPAFVRNAGPAPHLATKDDPVPWMESWRALEDLHDQGLIKAIGVSNFELAEMKQLMSMARIKPYLHQGNIWKVFFDPALMAYLEKEGIFFQVFSVLSALQPKSSRNLKPGEKRRSDAAFAGLEGLARDVTLAQRHPGPRITAIQVLLRYFVQQGHGVIPRTTSRAHLGENARVLTMDPGLSAEQMLEARSYLEELIRSHHGKPPITEADRLREMAAKTEL